MMQVMLGGGKGSQQGKGGEDLWKERQKIWEKKALGGKEEMISTGKGVLALMNRLPNSLVPLPPPYL